MAITLFATFFGYHFLLNQMCPPHSLQDAIIHYIVPLGTVGEHLLFHRYGGLKWYHPLLWAVTPLVYYGYVLCMYFADIPFIGGYFPYFFMDHLTNGAGVIALYLAAFYVGMTAAGFAAFGIDRLISSLLHKRKR